MKLFISKQKKFFYFSILITLLILLPSIPSKEPSLPQHLFSKKNVEPQGAICEISVHPHLTEMIHQVNTSTLYNHIKTLQDFGPHPTGSEALRLAANYLFEEFENLSYNVYYHNWDYEDHSDKNIIATLPGTNPTENVIILCAHYDTIAISPGADDDSSGVASVLMIAEILKHYQFNNTIKFILFSGEEQGLYGSKVYAKECIQQGEQILAVLALDKIAYATSLENGQKLKHHTNPESAWMVQISKFIAQLYPQEINLNILISPPDPGSDHKSFTDLSIDGSDFVRYEVNPFYHTSEDIVDHLNITYLTKVCKLALGTIITLADITPNLSEENLHITMMGTHFADPAQFAIGISNFAYPQDTANISISVAMKHLFRNSYVETIKPDYNIPCNWTMEKMITDYWEFQVGGRKYTRGLFKMSVTLKGYNDDIHIYKTEQTYGIIINHFKVWMIPKQ